MLQKFTIEHQRQVQDIKPWQSKTTYFSEYGVSANIQLQNLIFTEMYRGRSIFQHWQTVQFLQAEMQDLIYRICLTQNAITGCIKLSLYYIHSNQQFFPPMKVISRYLKDDDHEIKLETNCISYMLCAASGSIAVHVNFEKLNCKRNSALVEKQQFNIACSLFIVADSKMRSIKY